MTVLIIDGDEYHFVLECKNSQLVQYRNQYIATYYRCRSSMLKFVTSMESLSENRKVALSQEIIPLSLMIYVHQVSAFVWCAPNLLGSQSQ